MDARETRTRPSRAKFRAGTGLAIAVGTVVLAGIPGCNPLATGGEDRIRSVVITARDDAHITTNVTSAQDPQGLRAKNYGKDNFLEVSYANEFRSSQQLLVSVALTRFDTAPLKDLEVQSATLQLFATRVDMIEPVRLVEVSTATGDWRETDVTFNHKPEWSRNPIATAAVYGASLWYSWDVTTAVATAKGGNVSFALGLRTLAEGKAEQVLFASHEASGPNAPRLVVIYSTRAPLLPLWAEVTAVAVVIVLVALAFLLGSRFSRSRRKPAAAG